MHCTADLSGAVQSAPESEFMRPLLALVLGMRDEIIQQAGFLLAAKFPRNPTRIKDSHWVDDRRRDVRSVIARRVQSATQNKTNSRQKAALRIRLSMSTAENTW